MTTAIRALVAAGFSLLLAAAPAFAQWAEIPGTRFDQAKRADGSSLLIHLSGGGTTSTPIAIINAWNSAALDTDSGRLMLVRHGGHADTAHNGVFAFDLATHRWLLLRETSRAYTPLPPTATSVYGPTYADGSPASVHTYDCEAYLPGVKRVYSGGGIYWSPGGASVPQVVWTWNTATREYERRQVRPGGYGCATVWDPVSNRLLLRLQSQWVQYNPSTDSYTTLFASTTGGDSSLQSTLFLDAAGRKVYRIDKKTSGVPSIQMVNLANLAAKEQTLLTEGDTAIETVNGVGGAFVNGRIVAFGRTADGTRGAAYTLIPNGCGQVSQPKCRWIRYDPPSGVTPPPPDHRGMWKRAFVRGGLFYVLPHANQNLWVLTMPWGASASPAPTPPSTTPPPEPNPLPSPIPSPTPTPPPTSGPAPTPTPIPTPTPTPTPTPPPPTTLTPFTVTVPIPNSDLSARWDAYPLWASGHGPMARGGKHARLAYDSRRHRMLLAGGDRDGSDAGNNTVWAFTVGGTATLLSPLCRPYPDWIPSFPDNVTWVYDSVRDRALIMPGYFTDLSRLQTVCGRADDRVLRRLRADGTYNKEAGIFNLTSNAWGPPTWPYPAELGYGGDQQTNWGAYDPQRDMVVRFYWDGAHGNNLQRLHLATNTWSRLKLPGGTAGTTTERARIRNTYATLSQPALDVQGRSIYVVAKSTMDAQVEWRLLRVNVDTGAAERIALPPGFLGPNVGDGGTDLLLSFDPVNRVLIHTLFPNLAGDVSAVYVCHVDAGHRWTTVPLPRNAPAPPLKANVGGFDAGRGSLVLIGGHATTLADGSRTPSPTHYWALTLRRG